MLDFDDPFDLFSFPIPKDHPNIGTTQHRHPRLPHLRPLSWRCLGAMLVGLRCSLGLELSLRDEALARGGNKQNKNQKDGGGPMHACASVAPFCVSFRRAYHVGSVEGSQRGSQPGRMVAASDDDCLLAAARSRPPSFLLTLHTYYRQARQAHARQAQRGCCGPHRCTCCFAFGCLAAAVAPRLSYPAPPFFLAYGEWDSPHRTAEPGAGKHTQSTKGHVSLRRAEISIHPRAPHYQLSRAASCRARVQVASLPFLLLLPFPFLALVLLRGEEGRCGACGGDT